jgi:hypothetical protein
MLMWTCQTCGETHEDRFDACWKCARTEDAVPPVAEQQVRGFSTVLRCISAFAVIGLILGFILGGIAAGSQAGSPHDKEFLAVLGSSAGFVYGGAVGATGGLMVGLFVWALFPYKGKR